MLAVPPEDRLITSARDFIGQTERSAEWVQARSLFPGGGLYGGGAIVRALLAAFPEGQQVICSGDPLDLAMFFRRRRVIFPTPREADLMFVWDPHQGNIGACGVVVEVLPGRMFRVVEPHKESRQAPYRWTEGTRRVLPDMLFARWLLLS